jgi:lipopolysaccharide/colanic/teichoic acid biosynthesis glycosyltransferase
MTDTPSWRPYRGKRVFDLALVTLAAIPALTVALPCALAVKLTSRGPVFFRQERIGLGGQPFKVWKFRTMVSGRRHSVVPDDQAITSAGRWLRRLSLDELPQLINVLRGEMSIVGPRPTLAYQVERYDARQRMRLCVRPGITGLAQVGGRNGIPWAERIELDLAYVTRQSPIVDLRIIAATFAVVASGSGASGHPADDPLVVMSSDQSLTEPGIRPHDFPRHPKGGTAGDAAYDQPDDEGVR